MAKRNIHIITRFMKHCHTIYSNLNSMSITYNKTTINYNSVNSFNISSRSKNDANNKIRENIIGAIINNRIPREYYTYSLLWKNLKDEIDKYISQLCSIYKLKNETKKCLHKAGRKNNYDLLLVIHR